MFVDLVMLKCTFYGTRYMLKAEKYELEIIFEDLYR